jgi:peroxiredoxin
VEEFTEQYGLTFPVLWDSDGAVIEAYGQQSAQGTAYPQEWIIGVDGTVKYVANYYDAERLVEVIEAELALQ